jgi:hypothetical protein
MRLGWTYLYLEHLHVVLSEPDDNGAVVIVNCSHHEDNRDQSCVIEIGEHTAIHKRTIIYYAGAEIFTPERQRDFLRIAQRKDDVSYDLLVRIVEGTDSDFIPAKARKAVEASWRTSPAQKPAAE